MKPVHPASTVVTVPGRSLDEQGKMHVAHGGFEEDSLKFGVLSCHFLKHGSAFFVAGCIDIADLIFVASARQCTPAGPALRLSQEAPRAVSS